MYCEVLKYLLLVTLAAAASDGRHKRNLASIKDFITSVLFEDGSTDVPDTINLKPDHEYQFYKVPGYDNILIKASPIKSVIRKVNINEPGLMLDIQPFESFLGTKDEKDTLGALENVNNLLSTEIFNEKESNSLKETIAPMIADTHKFMVEGDIKPLPKVSKAEPYQINKLANEVEAKEIYSVNNKVLNTFTAQNITNTEMKRDIALPKCNQRRIDEIVSFSNTENDTAVSNIKYPNSIDKISSNEESLSASIKSDSRKDRNAQNKIIKHLFDLNAVDQDLSDTDHNIKRIEDKTAIGKMSVATPSHSVSTPSIPMDREERKKFLRVKTNENKNTTYSFTRCNNTNKIHTEIMTTKGNNSGVEKYADKRSSQDNASSHINKQHLRNNSLVHKAIKDIDEVKENFLTNLTTTTDLTSDNHEVAADNNKVNMQNKVDRSFNRVKESRHVVAAVDKRQAFKGRGDIPED